MRTTPVHRRALLRGALLATAAVTATAGLAACSSGGSSGTNVTAAQSAASRVAGAASSGAASVSSNPATSSDGAGNGGSDTSTSCNNLVSKQQLASILHHAVTDVSSVAGGCIATDASDPSNAYSFGVHHDAGCWSRATSFSTTPVSGIGDAAVGSGLGLEVKHGSTCIGVGGGTAAETKGDFSADIAVARIILGKLG